MKTRKITVFALASVLGVFALTGCGSIFDGSLNISHTPASSSTAQSSPAAQGLSYDGSTNTASQSQTASYQASTSAEQTAAQNALACAGGSGYKIISSESVQTSDGTAAYRFGIVPADNAQAPAWYYVAGENFAMTEGDWINKQGTVSKEEWDAYQDSAEHRYAMAYQTAVQNAIAASGIEDAQAVSCDFINYDYDKLQYAFKVGIKSMSDQSGNVQYFMAGTDYAVNYEG